MEERTSGAAYIRKLSGHLTNAAKGSSQLVDELVRKSRVIAPIPNAGLLDVRLGGGSDDQSNHR